MADKKDPKIGPSTDTRKGDVPKMPTRATTKK